MTINTELALPVVDLSAFLQDPNSEKARGPCQELAQALHEFGSCVIRDPRVTEDHNEEFLDLMELYFSQSHEQKLKDARPEYAYQVGVTPDNTETPRCTFDTECIELMNSYSDENKPHVPKGPDPKWRYFWRIGERPKDTKFAELNAEPVIPEAFPQWSQIMNKWGGLMLQAVSSVAEMAAVGFGMERDGFSSLCRNGPHLLAPTGSDVGRHSDLDTIFAGFHYDLNFLTIHGKSRFPGLLIWSRSGQKVQVRVPTGCLLVQAGKQFEYLTGGHVQAGFHEVVVLPETKVAIERARAENRPLWRISSTLFYHVASDQTLQPLEKFRTPESTKKYPAMLTGEQVQRELESITLKQKAVS